MWLDVQAGSSPAIWQMRHRTDDYQSEIVNQIDGRRLVSQRSFFDPTWYGAYRALRDGMFDYQNAAAPIVAHPTPEPLPTTLKTIAVTSVMGPGIYAVYDRGATTCANGDPGHALHLVSRNHDPRHQLSDVVVDTTNMRFCSIRFDLADAFGFHGIMEEHYSDVGGYWVQTGGFLDGTLRAFGISMHHGVWHYTLDGLRFPSAIPEEAFVPSPKQ